VPLHADEIEPTLKLIEAGTDVQAGIGSLLAKRGHPRSHALRRPLDVTIA